MPTALGAYVCGWIAAICLVALACFGAGVLGPRNSFLGIAVVFGAPVAFVAGAAGFLFVRVLGSVERSHDELDPR